MHLKTVIHTYNCLSNSFTSLKRNQSISMLMTVIKYDGDKLDQEQMSPKYKSCRQHWNRQNDSVTRRSLTWYLSRCFLEHFPTGDLILNSNIFFLFVQFEVTFSNAILKIFASRNGIQSNHWYFRRMMIQKLPKNFPRFWNFQIERENSKVDGRGSWDIVRSEWLTLIGEFRKISLTSAQFNFGTSH